jgi:RNA polymerase sporulation-specific sigma factor
LRRRNRETNIQFVSAILATLCRLRHSFSYVQYSTPEYPLLLSDILGTDEDVIYRDMENEAERRILRNAVAKLSERERTIVSLRFGLDTPDGQEMTQKEVAAYLGISQSYISRLEKKIMKRLKKEMVRE